MTSATTARLYKKELIRHARKTGFKDVDLNFLVHDFSMRGMAGVEAAIMSGMGHMTSFCGSETIPAIAGLEEYYNANAGEELIAATIPATEHSVMCAGGKEDELETFRRLITEVYPTGFVSIVSDTWDFWKVMTEYLPKLKDEILARDGRLVIRPDSGNPVHIIAGYKQEDFENWQEQTEAQGKIISPVEWVGAYEVLWKIFGGTINEKGYKVLNPKVGIIYGDSITLERQKEIYKRLEERGFAATNLVLGVGSYTYLMSMRMDRVISYDESFSLSIVAQVINNMSPQAVHVLEPHSYRVQDLINAYWGDIATPIPDFRGYLKVYPDRGALQRYGGDSTKNVICSKVRDPKTGQLSGFKIENPEVIEENQDLPLVVIDDLCDGGGTFKGIAQLLESHCPNRDRAIYVTHMVNPKGIATLSENYKEVYFTNSYRDWGREVLPNNVKVIEVV